MTRPLPQLTAQNEFFWTSGADGQLRIQECLSCQCADPSARTGVPVLPQTQDGRARSCRARPRSSAFTVNHRFGFPDLPPPYVVAQVAIAEDPRVRLTTNIIDCDPDELELGQPVEVAVPEQTRPDVWLPLFKPAADEERADRMPEDEIAPERLRQVRPADAHQGEVRGPLGDHRHRHVEDRPQADGPAAVADHRGVREPPSPTRV